MYSFRDKSLSISSSVATLLITMVVFSGAAIALSQPVGQLPGVDIWRWQERYIRLVDKEKDAPPNDHPVRLSPKQVGVMLGELKVKMPIETSWFFRNDDSVEDGIELLFSDKELAVLSDAVSRGLMRARPDQDLAFFTSSNFDQALTGGILKERALNTGRIFFRDGRLNILFGEVHGEYPEEKGAGALVAYKAREPVLAWREKESNHIWEIVTLPGILFEENRTDWVILNEPAAMARYEERKRLRKAQANVPQAIAEGTSQIANDQEALRRKVEELERLIRGQPPRTVSAQQTTSAPAATTTTAPATPDKNSVEYMQRRLEILKNLRDQDLIPEAVYQQQVEEILNKGF